MRKESSFTRWRFLKSSKGNASVFEMLILVSGGEDAACEECPA